MSENYDKDYLHLAEAEYQTIIQSCKERAVHVPVTKQELKKAINSLNRNKAADFYGITAENIVYGGDNLGFIRGSSFCYCLSLLYTFLCHFFSAVFPQFICCNFLFQQEGVMDVLYSPIQILEGWKSHFEQLAERSICENYDKDYLHLAEAEYQTIIQSCKERAVHVPVTKQEVKKAINSLNRNQHKVRQ
jgi:hypothetical protein